MMDLYSRRDQDLFTLMPVDSLVVVAYPRQELQGTVCRVVKHFAPGFRVTKKKLLNYKTNKKEMVETTNDDPETQIVVAFDFKKFLDPWTSPWGTATKRKPTKTTLPTWKLFPVPILTLGQMKLEIEGLMRNAQF